MEYSIFPVDNTPQYLLDRHPNPAKYGEDDKFYVFGDDDITGETEDIAKKGFNHQFKEGNPGLTIAQLKVKVNSRISNQEAFKLSLEQGRYMWEQEWKPKEVEV